MIAITGGAGFLGRGLLEVLVASGESVRILDNFDGGDDPAAQWRALSPGLQDDRVELVVGDVRDPAALARLLVGSPRALVHLAGRGDDGPEADAAELLEVNAVGAARVCRAAAAAAVPHLILASSSAVYGAPAGDPCREDDPCRPLTPYGVSLQASECLAATSAAGGSPQVTVLRFFSIYGVGAPAWSRVERLGSALAAGTALPGTRPATASHTHVRDAVGAIVAALSRTGDAPFRVYNIAHPEPVDDVDLVAALADARGRGGRPTHGAVAEREQLPGLVADVRRAELELGFVAQIDLAAGLTRPAR